MSLLPPWCERALHTQTSAGCPWSSSHWHWLGGDRFGGLPEGAVFFWWYVQTKYCLSFWGKKEKALVSAEKDQTTHTHIHKESMGVQSGHLSFKDLYMKFYFFFPELYIDLKKETYSKMGFKR